MGFWRDKEVVRLLENRYVLLMDDYLSLFNSNSAHVLSFRPYDGRWSKTMVGYGPEDNHFVLELTYNYGISAYRHGDALDSIDIEKRDLSLVKKNAECVEDDGALVFKNNGYKFRVFQGNAGGLQG